MEAIVAVIALVGSAAGAIWAAYVGTKRRVLAELEGRYDAELRSSRLCVYPGLWATLDPLAKYAREPPGRPRRQAIETMAVSLRRWYFQEGGIYLSAEARQAYFQLQDALDAVISSERWPVDGEPDDEIDTETFYALRKIGSWLRTTLTYDVGTRRRFSLAPEWQEQDAKANEKAVKDDLEAKREANGLKEQLESAWGAPPDGRDTRAGQTLPKAGRASRR